MPTLSPALPVALSLLICTAAPLRASVQAVPFVWAGLQVPLTYPEPPNSAQAEFLNWKGFQYLGGSPGIESKPYALATNWGLVSTGYQTASDTGVPWRAKVVVFEQTEALGRDSIGVLRPQRESFQSIRLQDALQALARFKAWVSVASRGKVSFVPDVALEDQPVSDSPANRRDLFGADFAGRYFEARINGGTYEADDKVFRGPYDSVLYLLPGAVANDNGICVVNATPVCGVSANHVNLPYGPGNLEDGLRRAWLSQVRWRLARLGIVLPESVATSRINPTLWAAAATTNEPATDTLLQNLRAGPPTDAAVASDPFPNPFASTWIAPGFEVSIATDADRGEVLHIAEKGQARQGGVGLPVRSDGAPLAIISATPTVSFFLKSSNEDPLALRVSGKNGHVFWVSAQRDGTPLTGNAFVVGSAPYVPNGEWHLVTMDVRSLAARAGVDSVESLAFEPSPNSRIAGKRRLMNLEYFVDQVKFSSDPAVPALAAPTAIFSASDSEDRALAASHESKSSPELIGALKDPDPLVRLNAVAAFQAIKDPLAEPALVTAASDLDPVIQEAALRSLAFQGSEADRAFLVKTLRNSLSDRAKAASAGLLAGPDGLPYAPAISGLANNNKSWTARRAGIEALGKIPGMGPAAMRRLALYQDNPEIKLLVTRLMDPNDPEDLAQLRWSAVDDPWDLVRAESDIKLTQSKNEKARADGYKGVKDDSWFVRLVLLDFLATYSSEENRNAARVAVTDRSAYVRAAALRLFSTLPSAVSPDEIQNVMEDRNPEVELALAALAKSKSIQLSPTEVDAMKNSPDPRVRAVAVR